MSDYIPEDSLVLIFRYLPVKTLLRFRCVSSCWKQLIDHSPTYLSVQKPRFIVDLHNRRYLVLDASLSRPLESTMRKPINGKRYVLFGTLHGVVCLYDYCSLVLWNPSLRKSRSIPLPPDFKWHLGEPKQTCYGFWIDSFTKEFKAIVLQQKPVVNSILYSSIRDAWTVIPTEELANWRSCKDGPPVMVGGVAHWGGCLDETVMEYHHFVHEHKDKVILSFNFEQESFKIIRMPDLYNMHSVPCHWQGALSLVCWAVSRVGDEEFSRGEIYSSRQEGSWVKMVDFKVYEPISIWHAFWVMEVEDIEEEERLGELIGDSQPSVRILAMIVDPYTEDQEGQLILYDTEIGWQTVRHGIGAFEYITVAYDFVESLLFP